MVTKLHFWKKSHFGGKSQKHPLKGFFGVDKKFSPLMCASLDLHDVPQSDLRVF